MKIVSFINPLQQDVIDRILAHGGRHRVPGYTDKGATEELGRNLKKLAALTAVNQPPNPELAEARMADQIGAPGSDGPGQSSGN